MLVMLIVVLVIAILGAVVGVFALWAAALNVGTRRAAMATNAFQRDCLEIRICTDCIGRLVVGPDKAHEVLYICIQARVSAALVEL